MDIFRLGTHSFLLAFTGGLQGKLCARHAQFCNDGSFGKMGEGAIPPPWFMKSPSQEMDCWPAFLHFDFRFECRGAV